MKEMFSDEIMLNLRHLPKGSVSWVMHDQLPKRAPLDEEYLIINLDDSQGLGTHWVIVVNNPWLKEILFFDSFGVYPSKRIIAFMERSGKPYITTNNEYQHKTSLACGAFTIDVAKYIFERAKYMRNDESGAFYSLFYEHYKPKDFMMNEFKAWNSVHLRIDPDERGITQARE